jgi:uncharacterized protein
MPLRIVLALMATLLLACGAVQEKVEQLDDLAKLAEAIDDPEAYAQNVESGCLAGDAEDCASLGVHYAFGTYGRDKDYAKAHLYLGQSCDGGHAYGCHDLGVLYMYGRGVDENPERAAELFSGTCPEIANSCHYMGDYTSGTKKGLQVDLEASHDWYQKACDAGSTSSCDR